MMSLGIAGPMVFVGDPEKIARFAIVDGGKVVNVINWDGEQPLDPALVLVAAPDEVGVGWDFADGEFVDNRPRGHQEGDVWVEDGPDTGPE